MATLRPLLAMAAALPSAVGAQQPRARVDSCARAQEAAARAVDSSLAARAARIDSLATAELRLVVLYAVDSTGRLEPATLRVFGARSTAAAAQARALALGFPADRPRESFPGCPVRSWRVDLLTLPP